MTHPDQTAFPETLYFESMPTGSSSGLTKREYFAVMALQGILAGGDTDWALPIAQQAVAFADDLIKALNKEVPRD